MAEFRQMLRWAAEQPRGFDTTEVRARGRRIRRRRGGGTILAVLILVAAVTMAVDRIAPTVEVRLLDRPPRADERTVARSTGPRWVAPADGPLRPRWGAVAAWSGSEMLVWGGYADVGTPDETTAGDGAAYDPAADRWRRLAAAPIPGLRDAAGVWTGDELWVLGGYGGRNGYKAIDAAAAYAPDDDAWRPLPDVPAPVLVAAWSPERREVIAATAGPGRELTVWTLATRGAAWRRLPPLAPAIRGDDESDVAVVVGDGRAFVVTSAAVSAIDLAGAEGWDVLASPPVPDADAPLVAAWAGSGPLVIAGDAAARYTPSGVDADGTWRRLPRPPLGTTDDTRIHGTEAGIVVVDPVSGDGAVFDPDYSRWSRLPRLPLERRFDAAVAVGGGDGSRSPRVFVWGGSRANNLPFDDGAILRAGGG